MRTSSGTSMVGTPAPMVLDRLPSSRGSRQIRFEPGSPLPSGPGEDGTSSTLASVTERSTPTNDDCVFEFGFSDVGRHPTSIHCTVHNWYADISWGGVLD